MKENYTDSNDNMLHTSINDIKNGHYENAINNLKNLYAAIQVDEKVCYHLGEAYFKLGKYEGDANYFNKSIDIKPTESAFIQLALTLGEMKRLEDAATTLKKGIIFHRDSADLYSYLGVTLRTLNRPFEEINAFETALKKDPNHLGANWGLGITYNIVEKFDKAIKCLTNAVKIKPLFTPAHFHSGINYLSMSDVKSAEAEVELLKSLDSNYAVTLKYEIKKYTVARNKNTRE